MKVGRNIEMHRVCRLVIGMVPPIGALILMLHVVHLLFGYQLHVSELLAAHSLFDTVLWIVASFAFRFCWVNRAFILYCYAVSVCIDYQRLLGFGTYLTAARVLAILIGLCLFAAFVKNQCWKE